VNQLITVVILPKYVDEKFLCTKMESWHASWIGGGESLSLGRGWCGWVYNPLHHQVSCKCKCPEGKMAISFHLHSELNILVDTIQAVKKAFQLLWSLGAYDEGPLTCHGTSTKLHSVTIQKIILFTITAVRTSNLTHFIRILLTDSKSIWCGVMTLHIHRCGNITILDHVRGNKGGDNCNSQCLCE
jgi:hypothetical protein